MSNARALTHRLSVIMTTQRGRRTDPIDPSLRPFLIGEVFRFIDAIRSIAGIDKIALVGSLTTDKPDPKDVDILVTVADDLDLTALATESRRLKVELKPGTEGLTSFWPTSPVSTWVASVIGGSVPRASDCLATRSTAEDDSTSTTTLTQ